MRIAVFIQKKRKKVSKTDEKNLGFEEKDQKSQIDDLKNQFIQNKNEIELNLN